MEIKPIRNRRDYRVSLAEVERLWNAVPGTSEHDQLEVVATLVHAYEEEHDPVYPPGPVDALRFRMEQLGLRRKDLEPYLGSRARVSEVLTNKRPLTLAMLRRLHADLGIPAEVLLGG